MTQYSKPLATIPLQQMPSHHPFPQQRANPTKVPFPAPNNQTPRKDAPHSPQLIQIERRRRRIFRVTCMAVFVIARRTAVVLGGAGTVVAHALCPSRGDQLIGYKTPSQSWGWDATYTVSDAVPNGSSLTGSFFRASFLARMRLSVGRGRCPFGQRDIVREGGWWC